jgi:hypothetical protein
MVGANIPLSLGWQGFGGRIALSLFSTLGQFQFPSSTLTASRGPNLPQDGLAAVLNL